MCSCSSTTSPDVVTIRFIDNRITGVCIIGSANPCDQFLRVGSTLIPAIHCLLRNGFVIITERSNVLVLRRERIF